jgi:uncharacterized NAD(P)/FAD-binding protein YdhS
MTDMSQAAGTKTIAVVGAGFSGTLCVVNLLRAHREHCAAGEQLRVLLIERNTRPGRGLAYRTWDDNFVLNVPAGNMSAVADDSGHFVRYCQGIDPAFNAGSFVSRRIYGDYLESTLAQAIEQQGAAQCECVHGEVLSVRPHGDRGFQLEVAGAPNLYADQVVLAFGHFAPLDPRPEHAFYRSDAYIGNPWDFAALDRIASDAPVALLGSAHTAIDVLFRMTSQRDMRKIYLISRRGLLPQPHRSHPQSPVPTGFPEFFANLEPTVRQYFRALRHEVRRRAAQGGDWRDVINSLRPHTTEIWKRFSSRERRRFLAAIAPYWDSHRHRLAPVAHLRLHQMIQTGQVETIAGYVQDFDFDGSVGAGLSMRMRERHTGHVRSIAVGHVVNCTGPNYDIARIDMPLLAQLRDEGYLLQDPLKLGIEVGPDYRAIGRQGQADKELFYIGPMLKAHYWEATAVPELRVHAQRLAAILVGKN